jgi:hypothetical protein
LNAVGQCGSEWGRERDSERLIEAGKNILGEHSDYRAKAWCYIDMVTNLDNKELDDLANLAIIINVDHYSGLIGLSVGPLMVR